MKKLMKYYGNIFNTYGILTPIVIVALAFVVLLAMEKNDVFTSLINNNKGWFVVLAIVGALVLVGCAALVVLKLKEEEINVVDLGLLVVSAIAVVLLVVFCFNPGNGSALSVFKWIVAVLVLVAGVAGSCLRSQYSK